MPDFDLNVWNIAAEAQLFSEYQALAARCSTEKLMGLRNVFRCSLTIPTSNGNTHGNTSPSYSYGGSTMFGPRLLKTTSFTMANTIFCKLPTVMNASADDRMPWRSPGYDRKSSSFHLCGLQH
jgi:hypothetical protein